MHYLRALSVEQGHLIGPEASRESVVARTEQQRDWLVKTAREVEVPAQLVPPDVGCYVFVRDAPAACLDDFATPAGPDVAVTHVGTYQPLPYLLPAVATRAADSPEGALRLGRLAGALLALCLLTLAVAAAWDARAPGLSLLGLALAATPMVIFCISILNGSSLEITAGIAFIACLFRIARGTSPARWVWVGVGISGAAFALSRPAAPLSMALLALAVLAVLGPRELWRKLRSGGRPAALAGAGIAAAAGLNALWEGLYGPDVPVSLTAARLALETGLGDLHFWLKEMVGKFGYLEFELPLLVYLFWGAAIFAAVALAIRSAPTRGRVVLAVCVVALAAYPLAHYVLVQRHTGFNVQGRHVLPVLVIVPLLAAELLRRNRERLPARWASALVAVSFAGIAIVQFTALYWNARRSAVGLDGPLVFLRDADWNPPIGWGLWLTLAAVGAACVGAAGFLAAKTETAEQQQGGLAEAAAPGQ